MLVDWWQFVMVAGADGSAGGGGGSVFSELAYGANRTTIHGFGALFSSRLGIRITIIRAANHCARGS